MGYPQESANNPYASNTLQTNPTTTALTSAFSAAASPVTSAITELKLLPEGGGFNLDKVFDYKNGYSADPFKTPPADVTKEIPWYEDGQAMQGYAGLASALLQGFALKDQMKTAKLQRKGLKQDIAFMNEDQTFRRTAKNNINKPRTAIS